MLVAAKLREAEETAAAMQSAMLSALAPSQGPGDPTEVLNLHALDSHMESAQEAEGVETDSEDEYDFGDVDEISRKDSEGVADYIWSALPDSSLEDSELTPADDEAQEELAGSDDEDLEAFQARHKPESPGMLELISNSPEGCQLQLMLVGFSMLCLLLVQALRNQRAAQALTVQKEAELKQPLLYMTPRELMAAVEKVPGAAVNVSSHSDVGHWENPIYYERLQGKE
jgi:hypothetical protein